MHLQIPVDVYKNIPFESVEKWIDNRVNVLKQFAIDNHQLPPLIIYLYKKNNEINEKIVHLEHIINNPTAKNILSEIIPQRLKEDESFVCISCFEAWLRNEKTFEIMDEVLIFNCEQLSEENIIQTLHIFKINRSDGEFSLENYSGKRLSTHGRFSNFLKKEIDLNPNYISFEIENPPPDSTKKSSDENLEN